MFLVDSKKEFQRTASRGLQYLLKLDQSIAALIEYVETDKPWPSFSDVSDFPEQAPEVPEGNMQRLRRRPTLNCLPMCRWISARVSGTLPWWKP